SLADMERTVTTLTDLLLARAETEAVFVTVGSGGAAAQFGSRDGALNKGSVNVLLKKDRKLTVSEIRGQLITLQRAVPDARVTYYGQGFGGSTAQIILASETGANLEEAGLALQRQMADVPLLVDPRPASPPS